MNGNHSGQADAAPPRLAGLVGGKTSAAPVVNIVEFRYSEAFVKSLRLWHRPGKGSVVVHVDPFTPRVPLELLFALGHGGTRSNGRTKELEDDARNWLVAAQVRDVLIPYAEKLNATDLKSLQRVMPRGVRVWLLNTRANRHAVHLAVLGAGWQISNVHGLSSFEGGSNFVQEPEVLPASIAPDSFISYKQGCSGLVIRGIEKVERSVQAGLIDTSDFTFGQWMNVASTDHNGAPCPFRLLGIVLKLGALGRWVEVAHQAGEASREPVDLDLRLDRTFRMHTALASSLWITGLSRLEILSIDTDQVAGNREQTLVAGLRFRGQLGMRIQARCLEAKKAGIHPWIVVDPNHLAKRIPAELKSDRPVALSAHSSGESDRANKLISPPIAELKALLEMGRFELQGESVSFGRAARFENAVHEAVWDLVDRDVVHQLERRLEIPEDLRLFVFRALRGTF